VWCVWVCGLCFVCLGVWVGVGGGDVWCVCVCVCGVCSCSVCVCATKDCAFTLQAGCFCPGSSEIQRPISHSCLQISVI